MSPMGMIRYPPHVIHLAHWVAFTIHGSSLFQHFHTFFEMQSEGLFQEQELFTRMLFLNDADLVRKLFFETFDNGK